MVLIGLTGILVQLQLNGAIGYTSTPTLIINGTNTTPAIASAQLNSGTNPTVGPGITVSCPVNNTYTYAWTNISTSPQAQQDYLIQIYQILFLPLLYQLSIK